MAKFRDSITDALGAPGIDLFRRLIEDYERDNDVPMADIAAALALQCPRRRGVPDDRAAAGEAPRAGRTAARRRCPRKPARRPREGLATYRIAVGKRHKVSPGAIVGAIANEGGLHRSDFGHISIRPDHSLVELPAKLSRRR